MPGGFGGIQLRLREDQNARVIQQRLVQTLVGIRGFIDRPRMALGDTRKVVVKVDVD
jgi:hypothetical protein